MQRLELKACRWTTPTCIRENLPLPQRDLRRWRRQTEDERVGDWVNRIGWPKFYERTGLPLSFKVIDGYDAHALELAKTGVRFQW